jgi:hypothetical protein
MPIGWLIASTAWSLQIVSLCLGVRSYRAQLSLSSWHASRLTEDERAIFADITVAAAYKHEDLMRANRLEVFTKKYVQETADMMKALVQKVEAKVYATDIDDVLPF